MEAEEENLAKQEDVESDVGSDVESVSPVVKSE